MPIMSRFSMIFHRLSISRYFYSNFDSLGEVQFLVDRFRELFWTLSMLGLGFQPLFHMCHGHVWCVIFFFNVCVTIVYAVTMLSELVDHMCFLLAWCTVCLSSMVLIFVGRRSKAKLVVADACSAPSLCVRKCNSV